MERLVQIVEQLAEAARCLKIGGVAHARIALLLLDNAAEMIMYSAILDDLALDDSWKRLYRSATQSLPAEVADRLVKESGYILVPEKQRKAVHRTFPPKVDYLMERGRLDGTIGDVINALHRYRNGAYHHFRVPSEILQDAATIYYEVACDLLTTLPPSGIVHRGGDDWSSFLKRFGVSGNLVHHDELSRVVSKLKAEASIDRADLQLLLSRHLAARLDSLDDNLQFIAKNLGSANVDETLKLVQFWNERGLPRSPAAEVQLASYVPKYTRVALSSWRQAAENLKQEPQQSKLEVLKQFCAVEQELEPLETMIEEDALEIDHAIELEMTRGE